ADIDLCYRAMADDASRTCFAAALRARLTGDARYLPISPYPQYFHPRVRPMERDILCEGGVEDGFTTLQFSKAVGESGRVLAFEPVGLFQKDLETRFEGHANIVLEMAGLWSHDTMLNIELAGGGSSVQAQPGLNTVPCRLLALDNYVGARIDMIK